MGNKADIRRIRQIAARFGMTREQRRLFGDYVEECKRKGIRGTGNERGDYNWQELEQRATEFIEPDSD
jgi:hypothetical protein